MSGGTAFFGEGVAQVESTDGSINVTNESGPIVDLSLEIPSSLKADTNPRVNLSGFQAMTWDRANAIVVGTDISIDASDHTVIHLADGVYQLSVSILPQTIPSAADVAQVAVDIWGNGGGGSPPVLANFSGGAGSVKLAAVKSDNNYGQYTLDLTLLVNNTVDNVITINTDVRVTAGTDFDNSLVTVGIVKVA